MINAAQPTRSLILGGEMGYRSDHNGGADFVNSGPALVLDAPAFAKLKNIHPHLISTFHFYKPRQFTNQGFPEVPVPMLRWHASAEDVDDLAGQFREVARAVNGSMPVYLGEFGVNIDFVPHLADAVAWVRTVRTLAEQHGFGWSYWTYYLSAKAATTAVNAELRLRQWDCSAVISALHDRPVGPGGGGGSGKAQQECPPRKAVVDAESFHSTREYHRAHDNHSACSDRRPLYAMSKLRSTMGAHVLLQV